MAKHILNAIIILINAQFARAHTRAHKSNRYAHKTNNSIIQTKKKRCTILLKCAQILGQMKKNDRAKCQTEFIIKPSTAYMRCNLFSQYEYKCFSRIETQAISNLNAKMLLMDQHQF